MRVAIVGTCASGKSTIASALNERGFDAYIVGQEHSEIRHLWSRRSPDALVFLEISLEAVRSRRSADWPEWLYMRQRSRLSSAREHADVIVDTSTEDVQVSLDRIVTGLAGN